jgi:hypothetical protein
LLCGEARIGRIGVEVPGKITVTTFALCEEGAARAAFRGGVRSYALNARSLITKIGL